MGKRIAWFDMESVEQRKKKEKRYFESMFPLGEEQRKRELELLAELIPGMKPEESLYQALSVKEILTEAEDGAEKEKRLAEWEKSALARRMKGEDRKLILLFARRSLCWSCLEDIPSAGEIRILTE